MSKLRLLRILTLQQQNPIKCSEVWAASKNLYKKCQCLLWVWTVCLHTEPTTPILQTATACLVSHIFLCMDQFLKAIYFTFSDKVSSPVLIPRGCPSHGSPTVMSVSPSIPIPTQSGLTCSPHGALACTGSPSSALPPLPCGSVVRRSPSMRSDSGFCQGSLRLCHSNRNSAVSLLSTSSCSDTSYMLGR